jgi:hypothetical protein
MEHELDRFFNIKRLVEGVGYKGIEFTSEYGGYEDITHLNKGALRVSKAVAYLCHIDTSGKNMFSLKVFLEWLASSLIKQLEGIKVNLTNTQETSLNINFEGINYTGRILIHCEVPKGDTLTLFSEYTLLITPKRL